jgi:hypothetical protein
LLAAIDLPAQRKFIEQHRGILRSDWTSVSTARSQTDRRGVL